MSVVQIRPTVADDLTFAFAVTQSAMRGYVEQTWGKWEPEQQRENHAESFNLETHSVVLVGEVPAGVIAVKEHADHVQLEKLYLLSEFRNHGVGSELLRQVLRQARSANKPVRLRVLAVNISAQRFYARHGFSITSSTKERVFMLATVPDR